MTEMNIWIYRTTFHRMISIWILIINLTSKLLAADNWGWLTSKQSFKVSSISNTTSFDVTTIKLVLFPFSPVAFFYCWPFCAFQLCGQIASEASARAGGYICRGGVRPPYSLNLGRQKCEKQMPAWLQFSLRIFVFCFNIWYT